MSYDNFINKIRYWDNQTAKWMMRHFYTVFFQIILVVIFIFWFINVFTVIDTAFQTSKTNTIERALAAQSINSTLLTFLLILNSFWMLFMFNGIIRLRTLLKDINYNISRMNSQKNFNQKRRPGPPGN